MDNKTYLLSDDGNLVLKENGQLKKYVQLYFKHAKSKEIPVCTPSVLMLQP